jgi:transcriptional regulator with XRE-family HTH domain
VAGSKRVTIIAKRLRAARVAAALSQRELGVRAGLDPSVASPRINQYEQAKHLPDPLTLERLGTVLNCPLPYFYAVDDDLAILVLAFHRSSAVQRKRWSADAGRLVEKGT